MVAALGEGFDHCTVVLFFVHMQAWAPVVSDMERSSTGRWEHMQTTNSYVIDANLHSAYISSASV